MNGRLIGLLVVLGALVVGAVVWQRTLGESMPAPLSARRPEKPPGAKTPLAASLDPAGYDTVTVTFTIPPRSAFPPGWWRTPGGCAHTRLSRVLGANISSGGGVSVFGLEAGKPAAEAGVTPGDRLGLNQSDCAKALYTSFEPSEKARTFTWELRRPRSAEFRRNCAAEAAALMKTSPPTKTAPPAPKQPAAH
jgi:hypothetical protein